MDDLTPSVMEARGVRVEASGREILADIHLALPGGQVTVLLGPNGAGKSTLLKAFAGIVLPARGEIRLNGKPLGEHGHAGCARARAALLQDFHLPFAFTVEEVAMMGRHPHLAGRESGRDRAVVRDCLAAADVHGLRDRTYPTLSGGERQRTHWARTLAQLDPDSGLSGKCALLDEPTSSLDLAHQHALLARARGLARRGAAVLIVLHDLNLAADYGDLLVLLRKGRVAARGTPAEVLTPDRIRETYGVEARVAIDPETGRPCVAVRVDAPTHADDPADALPFLRSSGRPVPV